MMEIGTIEKASSNGHAVGARSEALKGAPEADGEAPAPTRAPRRKATIALWALAVVLVVAVGVGYSLHASGYESTDDAFIEGHVAQISPKVSGNALRVNVTDNQHVKAGDALVELDPRDYAARVAEARATLDAAAARARSAELSVGLTDTTSSAVLQETSSGVTLARAAVDTARAQLAVAEHRVSEARARVVSAQAEAQRAAADAERYDMLFRRELISRQDFDNATATTRKAAAALDEARAGEQAAATGLHQAESQVAEAQAKVAESLGRLAGAESAPRQVAVSRAQADVLKAEVEKARADLVTAQLNLSYTKIVAPVDGKIARKVVEVGPFVQPGQALLAIVPDDLWVTANFKETQLARMRPGQPVEIKVDAFPRVRFHGHVDSIQSGSGARFSLLPPENATGNYVKVVQRVPVKVVFDGADFAAYPFGPGMSVEPTVKLR